MPDITIITEVCYYVWQKEILSLRLSQGLRQVLQARLLQEEALLLNPLAALLMLELGAGLLGDIYSARSAMENYSYTQNRFAENSRFWSDYERNTGVKVRYPYRSGAVNNLGELYTANAQGAHAVSHGSKRISDLYGN